MKYSVQASPYKIIYHLLFFLSLLNIFTNCTVGVPKNTVKRDALKLAVTNSIKIPIWEADTIIYKPESDAPICHHITKKEHSKFFHPHLEDSPYSDTLKKRCSLPILFVDDKIYDQYSYNKTLSKYKVFMIISGYMTKRKALQLDEIYCYNGKLYLIKKLFTYTNNQWTYFITKEGWVDY